MIRKLSLLVSLALPCALFGQITLYQESFTADADGPMSNLGWVGHISRGGPNPFYGQVVPHNDGVDASPSYINAYIVAGAGASAPSDPSGANGFLLFVTGYSQLVAWTDSVSIGIDPYDSLTFNWSARNQNGAATVQPLIRIDDTWYVTNSAISSATNPDWTDHSLSATRNTSDWVVLNFDGTTTDDASGLASYGAAPTVGLSGTISAIGFLLQNVDPTVDPNAVFGSGSMRLDNYSLTAVPEPSTYALLGGLAVLGFAQLRRRKKQAA